MRILYGEAHPHSKALLQEHFLKDWEEVETTYRSIPIRYGKLALTDLTLYLFSSGLYALKSRNELLEELLLEILRWRRTKEMDVISHYLSQHRYRGLSRIPIGSLENICQKGHIQSLASRIRDYVILKEEKGLKALSSALSDMDNDNYRGTFFSLRPINYFEERSVLAVTRPEIFLRQSFIVADGDTFVLNKAEDVMKFHKAITGEKEVEAFLEGLKRKMGDNQSEVIFLGDVSLKDVEVFFVLESEKARKTILASPLLIKLWHRGLIRLISGRDRTFEGPLREIGHPLFEE